MVGTRTLSRSSVPDHWWDATMGTATSLTGKKYDLLCNVVIQVSDCADLRTSCLARSVSCIGGNFALGVTDFSKPNLKR